MSQNNVVSIHPYFKVKTGQLENAKKLLRAFVEKTRKESKVLYYDFTIDGDTVFCREAYIGADGLLQHIENVDGVLKQMLQISELVRCEIHGPAAELEKLRKPFADIKPAWFVYECGLNR